MLCQHLNKLDTFKKIFITFPSQITQKYDTVKYFRISHCILGPQKHILICYKFLCLL